MTMITSRTNEKLKTHLQLDWGFFSLLYFNYSRVRSIEATAKGNFTSIERLRNLFLIRRSYLGTSSTKIMKFGNVVGARIRHFGYVK